MQVWDNILQSISECVKYWPTSINVDGQREYNKRSILVVVMCYINCLLKLKSSIPSSPVQALKYPHTEIRGPFLESNHLTPIQTYFVNRLHCGYSRNWFDFTMKCWSIFLQSINISQSINKTGNWLLSRNVLWNK